jgi:biotin carboxyl carrier protein
MKKQAKPRQQQQQQQQQQQHQQQQNQLQLQQQQQQQQQQQRPMQSPCAPAPAPASAVDATYELVHEDLGFFDPAITAVLVHRYRRNCFTAVDECQCLARSTSSP